MRIQSSEYRFQMTDSETFAGSGCKLTDDFTGHRDARSADPRPRTAISL